MLRILPGNPTTSPKSVVSAGPASRCSAPGTHSVTSSSSTRKPAGLPPGNDSTVPRPRAAQLTPSSQSRGQDPALGPDAGVMHLETMDTSSLPRSPWILCLSPTQECRLRRLLSIYDSSHFPLLQVKMVIFLQPPRVHLGVLHALG